ncbi:MAG: aminomethyl-transferring glycine dehydrogenase subunit GcvPA [Candidatus Fermentibacterota bacterium]
MTRYIPNQDDQRRRMLERMGAGSFEDLLAPLPQEVRLDRELDLPGPVSELSLHRQMAGLARTNTGSEKVCFAGGGAYDHFIPAAVDHILSRSEFYTAYTPYQAEASQGTLQSIFEYQTMVARLCGMEIANASMYDGASAAAEAALMAIRVKRKDRVLVAGTLNPRWLRVIRTYLDRAGFFVGEVPFDDGGRLDEDALEAQMEEGFSALVVQYPDYFGQVFDLQPLAEKVHSRGGLLVVAADPVALAMLKSPGECGADIVVGEGQSLGIPLCYGGPYCGFMASRKKLARKMPGRLIGKTVDRAGETGYVMTLQTREQHIRREKATSNICTNQALSALTNCVYMALLGETGLREVARQCYQRTHYMVRRILEEVEGAAVVFDNPFFREAAVLLPASGEAVRDAMLDRGYLAGIPVPGLGEGALLLSATEKRTREEIDGLAENLAPVCREVAT